MSGFADGDGPLESEFDKEAWISSVLLEWGACGQLATDAGTGVVVGSAMYAPPGRVPRSRHFPTAPVSADAVLLTSLRTEPGFDEAAPVLLDAVVDDLTRRGVRAIEAFGLVRTDRSSEQPTESTGDLEAWPDDLVVKVAREILDGPQAHLCELCMIDAQFLTDSAFEVVAAHRRFPRFRLELDEGLGWKSAVEGALERLVVMAAIDVTGVERSSVTVATQPGNRRTQ